MRNNMQPVTVCLYSNLLIIFEEVPRMYITFIALFAISGNLKRCENDDNKATNLASYQLIISKYSYLP